MEIGEKIKALRKSLGMTQQQLGGEEFTKGYISQIEKGTVTPSMKVLNLIASRLSKPVTYFLEDEDDHLKGIEEKFINGANLYIKQEYDDSIVLFYEIVAKTQIKSSLLHTNAMLYIGKCLYYLGQYERGADALENAIHQLIRLSSIENLVDAFLYKGLCLLNSNNYPLAIDALQKGLQIIDGNALMLKNYKAELQLNIAMGYLNIGKLALALKWFENGISFCKKEQVNDTLLNCYVRSGYLHYRLGNLSLAKERILAANSINIALNNALVWTEIYCLLGLIALKEGMQKQALKLLDKSITICKNSDFQREYYMNIIEKISMLIEVDSTAEAEGLINTYYEKIHGLKDPQLVSGLLINQGKLERRAGNSYKAIECYTKAIDSFIQQRKLWEIHTYAKELADLLMEENSDLAKKYYSLSFEYISQVMSMLPL